MWSMMNLITYFRNIRLQLKWSAIKTMKNDQVSRAGIAFHRMALAKSDSTRNQANPTVDGSSLNEFFVCMARNVCAASRMARSLRVHRSFKYMNRHFHHLRDARASSARASSFLFSTLRTFIFAFCVHQPEPLPTKWLMIISYISICSSVLLISAACVSVRTLFIDRGERASERCEHF